MPSDPRSFDDDTDLHVGLDRELDLAAERPSADAPQTRGPGLMVAAIVASSLALSGVITLARGEDDAEESSAAEPESPDRSAVIETPAPPTSEPSAPAPIRPSAGLESVRTKPALAASMSPTPPPPAEITPAAIASPTARRRSPERTHDARRPLVEPEPRYELPVPTFDEPDEGQAESPAVEPPPSAVSPEADAPAPASEKPSVAEPERPLEPDAVPVDPTEGEADAQPPARDRAAEPPLPGRSRADVPPEPVSASAPAPDPDPLPV